MGTQRWSFARNMGFNAFAKCFISLDLQNIIKGEEELFKNIFGEYVSVYDFKSAIDDGATYHLAI